MKVWSECRLRWCQRLQQLASYSQQISFIVKKRIKYTLNSSEPAISLISFPYRFFYQSDLSGLHDSVLRSVILHILIYTIYIRVYIFFLNKKTDFTPSSQPFNCPWPSHPKLPNSALDLAKFCLLDIAQNFATRNSLGRHHAAMRHWQMSCTPES